jgi:hypothetical protein
LLTAVDKTIFTYVTALFKKTHTDIVMVFNKITTNGSGSFKGQFVRLQW